MRELHLEYRPKNLKEVVGQDVACKQLIALDKSEGGVPHCLLFSGPPGCGKTTLARIVRRKLKCAEVDFSEVNAALNRGVDMVRDIQSRVGLSPLQGNCRVWLIDECHQLTSEAQGAFLKLLEEPPDHAYFMLATTNPEKLRKAIRSRSTEITVHELAESEIIGLVDRIALDHCGVSLDKEVSAKLAEVSEGSARKALVLLEQVIGIPDQKEQIKVLQNADTKRAAIEIARALMKQKPSWSTVAKIIKGCDDDAEGVRRMILAYFTTVSLGGARNAGRAVEVMEEFQDNYFDTGRAGLVMSAFRACKG